MPYSKNQIIRYQTLDRCFRSRVNRYFIDDLVEACQVAIEEFSGNAEAIQKRQIYNDIAFMKSDNGYAAPIIKDKIGRSVYYYYEDPNFSINNQPLTEDEALELKETLLTLNRFKGLPQFEWIESMTTRLEASFQFGIDANQVIEFDQNEFLKGKEFINALYHAIINKTPLEIHYQSFKENERQIIELHPYYLKQFNNRWFVFGQNPKFKDITNLALDRIEDIAQLTIDFIETDINFKEYFEDFIGVTRFNELSPCKVVLRIERDLWPYIETKPLHGSQRVLNRTIEFIDVALQLIPNYELEAVILQHGERIEVLEPLDFRNKITGRLKKLIDKYNRAE
ncbi:hypothetical protein BTO09_06500 [Gilvibacter sp. SZ-19]|uniref:helix-turn-helix transcriptional regulator n=1 Tax=Gilvibacter sp. SZ-19 TaxID=754429 RepID=UPI000B3C2C2D|nr:WYL domain-containing protein [Gilvibacter sp. SZ-19]ARV12017.1 hypothetical protein BTO09_06500 [Gilvibacter sp. SZ-19]